MCENYCRIQLLSQLKQRKTLELNQQQNLYPKIQEIVQKAKLQAHQTNLLQNDCHFKPKFKAQSPPQQFKLPNFKQSKMKEIKYQIGHLKTEIQSRQIEIINLNQERISKSIVVQRQKFQTETTIQYPMKIRGSYEITTPRKVIIFSQRNSPKKCQQINFDAVDSFEKNYLDNSIQ